MKYKGLIRSIPALAAAALGFAAIPVAAQQASLTLGNNDAQFCYKHENNWSLEKGVKQTSIVDGVGTVTWTVTATKSSGATTFTVFGGLTITNTGSAPATIGNIVVNLQKPNNKKISGKNVPWVSAAADVADATSGDSATKANIVAAGSAESQPFNAAFGAGNYTVSGAQGTFIETAGSGALEFTDASSNTLFSLTPQPVIPAGQSITLLYQASFNTSILPPAGTQLRVEAMVSFGNAGTRGTGGASANNIDVNGDGGVDSVAGDGLPANQQGADDGDEKNVRTVPSRVTLAALPAAPEECNNVVTLSDTGVTTTGSVTTSNPVGFGTMDISASTSLDVSIDVNAGNTGGSVCNEATLEGMSDGGTLNVVVGQKQVGTDPITGMPIFQPIYATYTCCLGVDLSADSCVDLFPPEGTPKDGDFTTYSQGGFQGNGVPGQILLSNFSTLFPTGLTIGIDDGAGPKHSAKWTSVTALRSFLAGGGPSGALTADTTNATSVSGGALAKQTAALTINIAISGQITSPLVIPAGFGNVVYHNSGDSLDGMTVSQILGAANNALGGNGLPAGYTFGSLEKLIENLNLSWDNGVVSAWAKTHLTK